MPYNVPVWAYSTILFWVYVAIVLYNALPGDDDSVR